MFEYLHAEYMIPRYLTRFTSLLGGVNWLVGLYKQQSIFESNAYFQWTTGEEAVRVIRGNKQIDILGDSCLDLELPRIQLSWKETESNRNVAHQAWNCKYQYQHVKPMNAWAFTSWGGGGGGGEGGGGARAFYPG